MSFETLAAAQQFARELNTTASAAVLGDGVDPLAAELATKQLEKVYAVEHALLKDYTPDGYSLALRQLIEQAQADAGAVSRTRIRCAISFRSWRPRWEKSRSATWFRTASTTARSSSCGSSFRAR